MKLKRVFQKWDKWYNFGCKDDIISLENIGM